MSLTRQQQDDLVDLIRRKGYRVRGRAGFLDRLGLSDAMTMDLLPEASWRWAVEYLTARPDVVCDGPAHVGQDNIGEIVKGEVGMSDPFKVKASSGGGDFTTCPAGTHPAVLLGLLDIGTYSEQFQGQPAKDSRKVLLVWEVHVEDERHYVGRDYTLSFNQKASLRQLVEKWRGKAFAEDEAFDLAAMVGKPCLLSIVHKDSASGNTYARVDGVMNMPKGMPAPVAAHKPVVWSVMSGGTAPDADWLPYLRGKPLQEVIRTCKERQGNGQATAAATVPDDADAVAF